MSNVRPLYPYKEIAKLKEGQQPDRIVDAHLDLRVESEVVASRPLSFQLGLQEPFIPVYKALAGMPPGGGGAYLAVRFSRMHSLDREEILARLNARCLALRYKTISSTHWRTVGTMDHLMDWALVEHMSATPWMFDAEDEPYSYLCWGGMVYTALVDR